MKQSKKPAIWLSVLLLFALVLSACTAAAPAAAPAGEAAATEAAAPEAGAAPAEATRPNVVYDLPDLGGRAVSAAMANDYTPLQFIDPATGEAVGWEYDAVAEICRRLNCVVEWQQHIVGCHDPGDQRGAVRHRHGRHHDHRRARAAGRLLSAPYMTSQQFMLVQAGDDRFATPADFAADAELLVGAQPGTSGFYTAVYDILDGDEANPRIKLFDNFGASVQALITGDVDMVLVDAASRPRLHRRQPRQAQDRGRCHQVRGLRLHLPARLRPRRTLQRRHRLHAGRWLHRLPRHEVVLPDRPERRRRLRQPAGSWRARGDAAAMANDYTPLQFIDPATGEAVGWEYDAVAEICRRLNCVVDWQTTHRGMP